MYSVLMSVYFKEKAEYLRAAMDSIWNQTVRTDDFVLVCDGPLNEELDEVIREMEKHHRELHVIRLEKNSGLGNALNAGLKECRNELVARMDSDDIALPERCEKQLEVFESYKELSICSGTIQEFWEEQIMGKRVLPAEQADIVAFSRKRNPFSHPAVMFRKCDVEKAGGYNEEYHLFEDYYLWVRMLKNGCRGYNLQEELLKMRTPLDAYKRRGGMKYARDMLRFHKWIRSSGWSSWKDYLTGAVPHAVVCVLPARLRGLVYKRLRCK